MWGVRAKEDEGIDALLRRFKKQLNFAGVMGEVRRRQHFRSPSEMRLFKRYLRNSKNGRSKPVSGSNGGGGSE